MVHMELQLVPVKDSPDDASRAFIRIRTATDTKRVVKFDYLLRMSS